MEDKLKRKLDLIKLIGNWLISIALLVCFLLIPMKEELYIFGLVASVILINLSILGTIFYIFDM